MKLGVSYNVFDGEELLENSIKLIRESVDYISVVYQTRSYYGNLCDPNLEPLLNKLKKNGFVDEIIEYKKINNNPQIDEVKKRNIGLNLSREIGCTHHMSMDSDEFFELDKFNYLKNLIETKDYDSSFCKMISYYKSGEYYRIPLEEYYVPLIYKIKKDSEFIFAAPCHVEVDPTRRMYCFNPLILSREELEMHHFSMVRNNISIKLRNSSSKILFNEYIDNMIYDYNNWYFPKKALWPGNPPYYVDIIKTNNKFI